MGATRDKRNPVGRFFRMLVEARWFFAFSASVCATIVGISLTFGLNGFREARRARGEMQKSMLQAVDNLTERLEDARRWVDIITGENILYEKLDSLYTADREIPDSLATEFYNSLPYIRLAAFDHEFEKVFRGSYQLWQLQNSSDSLSFYITQCYDGLNIVEETCRELSDGMIEQIGDINASTGFYRSPPLKWTMTLLDSPRFQYFMSVRIVKASVASYILEQVKEDYDRNVIPRSLPLRDE